MVSITRGNTNQIVVRIVGNTILEKKKVVAIRKKEVLLTLRLSYLTIYVYNYVQAKEY